MNTNFTEEEKRLLVLHFATDPEFQQHVLDGPPGIAASWNIAAEIPQQLVWKTIDSIIDSEGPGRINSVALAARMSADPLWPSIRTNAYDQNQIQNLLFLIDGFDPSRSHVQAMTTLQRFLDVRIALAAANLYQGETLDDQVAFLQDQLAAVRPAKGGSSLEGALTAKIDIGWLYSRAPQPIQLLTTLLVSLNPKIPTALHFFTARALIHGLLGKRLSMINNGTLLYAAYWFVGLATTGMGKSALRNMLMRVINAELARWHYCTPAHLVTDNFTTQFLFGEMGDNFTQAEWQRMTDADRAGSLAVLRGRSKRRPGRVMICDEFGQNLRKLLKFGADTGEIGNLLKLADNGGEIQGDTAGKGKRVISDICFSIIGWSQPETWVENFDPSVHLSSGLAGRFTLVNHDSFELNLAGIPSMTSDEVIEGIRLVIRDLLTRLENVADRVVCERSGEVDEYGAIFEQLIAEPQFKEIIEFGYIDVELLRGKLLNQSLKMTMVDTFLNLDAQGLRELQGIQVIPETYTAADPNSMVDPEAATAYTEARTTTLYNADTFRANLWACLWQAVRAFNLDTLTTELSSVQHTVRKKMRRNKGYQITTGQLTQLCLKLGGRPMSVWDVETRVMDPLVDAGEVIKRDGRKKTPVYTLTNHQLVKL